MRRIFVALALFLSLTAVHSETHDDVIAKEVTAVVGKMLEHWNDGDLLGAIGLYMNAPDSRLVRDGEVYQGWRNIYNHYQEIFEAATDAPLGETIMTEIVVEPMNANTATVFYKWEATDVFGQTEIHGATFMVVKRSGPYWRVTHASMSTSLPNFGKGSGE